MDVSSILALLAGTILVLGSLVLAFSILALKWRPVLITLVILVLDVAFLHEVSDLEAKQDYKPLTWEQVINHFKPW